MSDSFTPGPLARLAWPDSFRGLLAGCLVAVLGAIGGCGGPAAEPRPLSSPAGASSAEPHLARGPDGTAVLSWLEQEAAGYALRHATLTGEGWQRVNTVARGADWFVNWADFPSVVPISAELWAAHWLVKRSGGTYAYDVAVAVSMDGGESWSEPVTPHTDGTATEHGFVSLFPAGEGIGTIWLDGRNMAADGIAGGADGGMTLRSAVLYPGGGLGEEALVDELVCDCCQTDVALASSGPVAAYRNRTTAEIRDVYLARYVEGRWQPGRAVADDGWEISGCPVNGPAIDARADVVAVAWFTGAQGRPRVHVARSEDAGATFGPPLKVAGDRAVGRVDLVMLSDGSAAVSWLRHGPDRTGEIVVRRVSADGTLGPIRVIAETLTSRPAGFPQMIGTGEELLFAWTHQAEDRSMVRTAMLEVEDL